MTLGESVKEIKYDQSLGFYKVTTIKGVYFSKQLVIAAGAQSTFVS